MASGRADEAIDSNPDPRPRLLVTGASGYLGRRVCRLADSHAEVLAVHGRHPERIVAGRPIDLDLRHADAVEAAVRSLQPHSVIHCAAANPGRAPEDMVPVNVEAGAAIARACAEVGARLVHVSSDVVFDGLDAPYGEHATLSPLGDYGHSKAAGERAVAEACPMAAIVRTSLIYALDEVDRGTAGFLARIEAGGQVELWEDVIRQPVEAGSLAAALIELALDRPQLAGPFHLVGEQAINRRDFGLRLLRHWGLSEAAIAGAVTSVRAADLDRPIALDLRLERSRAESEISSRLPGVDAVLGAWRKRRRPAVGTDSDAGRSP